VYDLELNDAQKKEAFERLMHSNEYDDGESSFEKDNKFVLNINRSKVGADHMMHK
jgi:hypothetical protein